MSSFSFFKVLRYEYCITVIWVPSHIGIEGNAAADATAKAALNLKKSMSLIPYSDFKPFTDAYINSLWQNVGMEKPTTNYIGMRQLRVGMKW